jgi:hypothetical protein
MASEIAWYTIYQGTVLEQGDILLKCPCFSVAGIEKWPPPEDAEVRVEEETVDAIVLTQSCDLENDKVRDVLFARVVAWDIACETLVAEGNERAKSTAFREALVQGNVPGLSLLHKSPDLEFPWSVVTFHQLFTLPRQIVNDFISSSGPRLRLASPYKEHLAQAFARFFMRVGLPHNAKAFIGEGKAGSS